ncbi:MAG: hypothetical protein P8020_11950, partial [Acidobacteriota bacterium]
YPDGLIVDPGAPAQASRTHDLHFAQFATGGGLFSEMLLMNLDPEEEADVEVEFHGSDGEALSFPLGGDVVVGQTYLSIPPLGMRVLQMDGSGALAGGSSHVRSTKELAGVLIFGGSFGLAGVGNSASLDNGFLAPMESNAAAEINTGIAVANLESEETTLHLRLLGPSGTELATSTEPLDPNGQKAVFLNELGWSPQVDLSDFQGLIEVTSSGRTAATVLQTRPRQYATMPVVSRSLIGSTGDLNFAQFATGGGLFSEMTLLNLDQQNDAQLDIAFRNFEGDPLSFQLDNSLVQGSLQVSVPASGMRILRTTGSGSAVGSARVSSNRSIAGVLVFGGAFGLAGVGSGEELQEFAAPMEKIASAGIDTGIAVMNLENRAVSLNVRLRNLEGQQLAPADETLAARGQRAVFVGEFSWSPALDLRNFQGVLEVTADGNVAVTVLQLRPGQYATMPVVAR